MASERIRMGGEGKWGGEGEGEREGEGREKGRGRGRRGGGGRGGEVVVGGRRSLFRGPKSRALSASPGTKGWAGYNVPYVTLSTVLTGEHFHPRP